MATALAMKVDRLLAQDRTRRDDLALARLKADPAALMAQAGLAPDPWQQRLLRSASPRMLLLCSRQAGKSQTAAALALGTALLRPRSPVLLLSPSLRQSGELFRKLIDLFAALGKPVGVAAQSDLRLELVNGSRIVGLPGTEGTIRGYSGVSLLVIDEAVSQGRLAALSTPFGKRGWFHDEWHGEAAWDRVKITAEQCPRMPPDFLAEEKKALGERGFRQEYGCSFEDTVDAVFSSADIQAALSDDVRPLFGS